VLLGSFAACDRHRPAPEVQPMSRPALSAVLERHRGELMQRPGVVGVYESAHEDGAPAITVMLADSAAAAGLPRELEGYPVDIEVSGPIRPLDGKR
jgi:hypothetical protein